VKPLPPASPEGETGVDLQHPARALRGRLGARREEIPRDVIVSQDEVALRRYREEGAWRDDDDDDDDA
jgi:hypothetical protein